MGDDIPSSSVALPRVNVNEAFLVRRAQDVRSDQLEDLARSSRSFTDGALPFVFIAALALVAMAPVSVVLKLIGFVAVPLIGTIFGSAHDALKSGDASAALYEKGQSIGIDGALMVELINVLRGHNTKLKGQISLSRLENAMKILVRYENPLDLNSATLAQLAGLPGIGRRRAKAIIIARPFERVEEIMRVHGIGRKTLQQVERLLTVDASPKDAD